MTNPAQAARQQAQSKWPGATVAERGRGYIRHQHPDNPGRFMVDTQAGGKWHYGDPPFDQAQEIDTAWQASGSQWDYEVTANDFHCFVRDSVPVSYRYLDVATGYEVELTVNAVEWVNDEGQSETAASFGQVVPTIDDDLITWPDIAPGWHVDIYVQTARLVKYLRIDTLTDLGGPTIGGTNEALRLSFALSKSNQLEVWVDGALWDEKNNTSVETSGNIEWRDPDTGSVVFWFKRPAVWDTEGQGPVLQRLRKQGGSIRAEVEVPWSWLQAATFPVTIDPTVDDQVDASGDDWSWAPSTSKYNNNSAFRVGYNSGDGFWGDSPVHSGFNFTVTGPESGDTIDVAYISIQVQFATNQDLMGKVKAVHEDNPNSPNNFSQANSFTETTAAVDWDRTAGWSTATWYDSPSIVTVIDDVIEETFWDSGDNLIVHLKDDGVADGNLPNFNAYDNTTTEAPKLHIEYTAAGGGTTDTPRGLSQIGGGVIAINSGGQSGLQRIEDGITV